MYLASLFKRLGLQFSAPRILKTSACPPTCMPICLHSRKYFQSAAYTKKCPESTTSRPLGRRTRLSRESCLSLGADVLLKARTVFNVSFCLLKCADPVVFPDTPTTSMLTFSSSELVLAGPSCSTRCERLATRLCCMKLAHPLVEHGDSIAIP